MRSTRSTCTGPHSRRPLLSVVISRSCPDTPTFSVGTPHTCPPQVSATRVSETALAVSGGPSFPTEPSGGASHRTSSQVGKRIGRAGLTVTSWVARFRAHACGGLKTRKRAGRGSWGRRPTKQKGDPTLASNGLGRGAGTNSWDRSEAVGRGARGDVSRSSEREGEAAV
jgi:hypothetical protein